MTGKKSDLDDATVRIVKQMLAMPPKHHDEMKVGRASKKKRTEPKARAASAKRRTASQTDHD